MARPKVDCGGRELSQLRDRISVPISHAPRRAQHTAHGETLDMREAAGSSQASPTEPSLTLNLTASRFRRAPPTVVHSEWSRRSAPWATLTAALRRRGELIRGPPQRAESMDSPELVIVVAGLDVLLLAIAIALRVHDRRH